MALILAFSSCSSRALCSPSHSSMMAKAVPQVTVHQTANTIAGTCNEANQNKPVVLVKINKSYLIIMTVLLIYNKQTEICTHSYCTNIIPVIRETSAPSARIGHVTGGLYVLRGRD